ncbi:MAG: hypothetical protein IFK94_12105 [Acidobacteria bacterium]|uniref:Uncharacterized protein n=1 Tax=Candidatus Polarisedimenticola svalbardensis TaxID=2886004 RepID=A0A8J6Y9G6_9BACT|nr:hypothetical protein [Candidatus Polarisedimenticola svalbardensis]
MEPAKNQETVAPYLASALHAWEELRLEVGETALVAGSGTLTNVFCLAALWCGACPVITLGPDGHVDGVSGWDIPAEDPEPTLDRLTTELAAVPAVAAVDLTGRAAVADMFFEVLPQYARLLLAGDTGEPLTIDYYVNIHRKGIDLMAREIDVSSVDARMLQRASALLSSPDRAEACLRAANKG